MLSRYQSTQATTKKEEVANESQQKREEFEKKESVRLYPCGVLISGDCRIVDSESVKDAVESILGRPIQMYDFYVVSEGNLYLCSVYGEQTQYHHRTFVMVWWYEKSQ